MSNSIQVSIYKIDKSIFSVDRTSEQIINDIIEDQKRKVESNRKIPAGSKENEKFTSQPLQNEELSNFRLKLFFADKYRTPPWHKFLRGILDEDSELLQKQNHDCSYVAFIYDDTDIFAITGGQGNFVVQDFIDQSFGINIIARLISRNDKTIKSLKERSVTGYILANTKFFRADHKLADEDEFGKIYKEVQAELKKELLIDRFGFSEAELVNNTKSNSIAKSSFRINKSINFNKLVELLNRIQEIERDQLNPINKVQLIQNKGKNNRKIIENLNSILTHKLFEAYKNNLSLEFDFSNPDFEKYFSADYYQVFAGNLSEPITPDTRDKLDSINDLLSYLKTNNIINSTDITKFKEEISKIKIKSFDSEGKIITSDKLLKHIHCELMDGSGNTYFLIDGNWYQINADFIDDLNSACSEIIADKLLSSGSNPLNGNWVSPEDNFNLQFLNSPGFFILHKIIPENIEPCDILYVTDSQLYFIHVKEGFNASVRDLASQIKISSRRIYEDLKTNRFQYIESIYDELENKKTSTNQYFQQISAQPGRISKENFVDLFRQRKQLIFCLAFVDNAVTERNIAQIENFDSNIAKLEIVFLNSHIRGLVGEDNFRIIQIPR